jgi:hypothetical protein
MAPTNITKTLLALTLVPLVGTLSFACAAPADEPETAVSSTAALQIEIDRFTDALLGHDTKTLETMMSSELVARGAERHIGLDRFLEKQRAAMISTFDLKDGERPSFVVKEVTPEGDAVRVSLELRGEPLKKPFYFVRESGELKLNIAPPGFSKAAPDGTLFGRESYQVKNQNIYGNASATMTCYRSSGAAATVTVAPGARGTVYCDDTCGWWAGSTFRMSGAYDGPTRKCDWNSWGDDVYINLLDVGGWRCNDGC